MPDTLKLPQLLPSFSSVLDEPSPEHARLLLDVLDRYDIPYEVVAPGYIHFVDALIRLDTWQAVEVIEEGGEIVRFAGPSQPIVRRRLPVEAALEAYLLHYGCRGRYAYTGCGFTEDTPSGAVERDLELRREWWRRHRIEGPIS